MNHEAENLVLGVLIGSFFGVLLYIGLERLQEGYGLFVFAPVAVGIIAYLYKMDN